MVSAGSAKVHIQQSLLSTRLRWLWCNYADERLSWAKIIAGLGGKERRLPHALVVRCAWARRVRVQPRCFHPTARRRS